MPSLAAYIVARDRICVVAQLETTIGYRGPCSLRLTIAHVRDRGRGGRTAKRPPSVARHLALVCEAHHLDDPVVDRPEVRDVVDRYLEEKEGPDVDDSRPWETVPRVRGRDRMAPGADGPAPSSEGRDA